MLAIFKNGLKKHKNNSIFLHFVKNEQKNVVFELIKILFTP